MIESKLFSEKETKNQRPEFSVVLAKIKEWYEDKKKVPEPLYIREGEAIHPKLKDKIIFKFWAIPEIGMPNNPKENPHIEDFIAVETDGLDATKYPELLNRVFKSFNEAKFELEQTAKNIFDEGEINNDETQFSKAA